MNNKDTMVHMDLKSYSRLSEQFASLGDPNRLRIFIFLCHKEESVREIARLMDISPPAVSHHLKILKETQLVEGVRKGKEVYYSILINSRTDLLHRAVEKMMDIVCPEQSLIDTSLFHQDQVNSPPKPRDIVRKIHDTILLSLDKRYSIEDLARDYHISSTSLKYHFREAYGKSIAAHINEHRMEKGKQLLEETDLPVYQIASQVGYASPSKFSSSYKRAYGLLPKDYRKSFREKN